MTKIPCQKYFVVVENTCLYLTKTLAISFDLWRSKTFLTVKGKIYQTLLRENVVVLQFAIETALKSPPLIMNPVGLSVWVFFSWYNLERLLTVWCIKIFLHMIFRILPLKILKPEFFDNDVLTNTVEIL